MNDEELRALMHLLMVSDPSPLTQAQDKALRNLADREARARGFDGWYAAYHQMPEAAERAP